ncbi:homoserine kinase [Neokomagataea thailandica NBRC 106555]|uniref:Homoserine kinase n=2 Tax=Neokomagataea TaxID=1223423 RepID=A0A4Y6V2C8_9PROT|nr:MULTISPECIES: homoserine kinase [Neokomagataea]QDH24143.1 homoserine kinase [Neokomagataea tanensis]GBR50504.1 homoserine kinase [Neokomagataea thailandica NBRC 106555]
MAVYTEFSEEALNGFLSDYALGTLVAFEGIAEGVENSNFLLTLSSGKYILTLFEKRMRPDELPWFLGLMQHLAKAGVNCPQPVEGKDGKALRHLAGKPAVITTFLNGKGVAASTPDECRQVGQAMAELHKAGQSYAPVRANALAADAWGPLLERCGKIGDDLGRGFGQDIACALGKVVPLWPQPGDLPIGQIHADLFPDNVFFQNGSLSGLIDFYFACTDMFAYDLAICLNAWCFEEREGSVIYRQDCANSLVEGYEQVRPLTAQERAVLPVLAQGAALRFVLTRLYDWINTPSDALVTRKDPRPYMKRFNHFSKVGHV